MARTPEVVLKEIVSNQVFTIAAQTSEIEQQKEKIALLEENNKKLTETIEILLSKLGERKTNGSEQNIQHPTDSTDSNSNNKSP